MNNKILVINAGSSSIKFQLFEIISKKPEFKVLARGLVERIAIEDSKITIEINKNASFFKHEQIVPIKDHTFGAKLIIEQLKSFAIIKDFKEIIGVGHRLVHGGEKFKNSILIDKNVEVAIKKNISLAPLHNPAALKGYNAFKMLDPKIKHVAVFDTSFHMTLAQEKFLYSVPYHWYQNYQVRKYGFHGISYRYILIKLSTILGKKTNDINAIVCHLGNGASICAIKNGASYDTTMGLTPLDGLIMGTRSGVVDPSIHQYICEITNNSQTITSVTDTLNKASGLLGISEISSDIRDILKASENHKHPKYQQANLAIKMFCQRIANYIVQYVNALENNIDALVFTAGIGENATLIRKLVIDEIKLLSLKLNIQKNATNYQDFLLISDDSSSCAIYKIRTNEEIMICQDTYNLLALS